MSSLDKAILIACQAHTEQVDKAGQPYIMHPLRLILKFDNDIERIVAVLHDVIEDSNTTTDDLYHYGFCKEVIDAINCLSKRDDEAYDDFILRISKNSLAAKIKIEDLKDNLNLVRINCIGKKDLARVVKYHKALKFLLGSNGNSSEK